VQYGGGVLSLWADSAGNLYAGGTFGGMGGAPYTSGVAYWDGSVWHALFIGTNGIGLIDQLGVTHGKLYALGTWGVKKWYGSMSDDTDHWTNLGFPSAPGFLPSALWVGSDGTVIASGTISQNGNDVTAVMKWTGVSWTLLGAANDRNRGFSAFARTLNGVLYAGGNFMNFAGMRADNIVRYDGLHWNTVGEGPEGVRTTLSIPVGISFTHGLFLPLLRR